MTIHSPAKRLTIFKRDGPDCVYCGFGLTLKTFTVDHKIPRSKGGQNHNDNLTVSCGDCNSHKGSGKPRISYFANASAAKRELRKQWKERQRNLTMDAVFRRALEEAFPHKTVEECE